MLPLWAILGGVGALKGYGDTQREQRERELYANAIRVSPWSHIDPQAFAPHTQGDILGSALGAGTAGLGIQQGLEQAESDKALKDAIRENYEKGGTFTAPAKVQPEPNNFFSGEKPPQTYGAYGLMGRKY